MLFLFFSGELVVLLFCYGLIDIFMFNVEIIFINEVIFILVLFCLIFMYVCFDIFESNVVLVCVILFCVFFVLIMLLSKEGVNVLFKFGDLFVLIFFVIIILIWIMFLLKFNLLDFNFNLYYKFK